MSTYPMRKVTHGWNQELYATGRVHAASFQVGATWIGGGVVYGYSGNHDRETAPLTNDLLQEMTKVLVAPFNGPAFVAGDFNQEFQVLEETRCWEQKGWKDIQTWAEEVLQLPAGPTCKYKTRKDFVYISPQLQQLLQSVSNEFDRFPDHSTLVAKLRLPDKPMAIPQWPRAVPIPYAEVSAKDIAKVPCGAHIEVGDPTEGYKAVFQSFEQHVDEVRNARGYSQLLPHQRGRGATLAGSYANLTRCH